MSPLQTALALLVPLVWGLQYVVIKVGLLQTVFAIAAGALVLHEALTPTLVAGAAICMAGVAVSQSRTSVREGLSTSRATRAGSTGGGCL